jgi:RNA:NAD 2'-phosphotransferase (TPT1/KptA family)
MAKPQKCPHCKMAIGKNPATEKAEEIFSHSLIPMEKQNVNPSTNYRHNKKVD